MARNGGNNGLGEEETGGAHRGGSIGIQSIGLPGRNGFEIRPRAECLLPGPPDHDDPDLGILLDGFQNLVQVVSHLNIVDVQNVGTIQGYPGDVVALFIKYGREARHRYVPVK